MDDLTNPIERSWQRRVEQRQGEKEGEKLTQTADHVNRPALAVWNDLMIWPPFSCHTSVINHTVNLAYPPLQAMCGKGHLWVSFVTLYSRQVECEPKSAITLLSNVCTLHRRTGNISYKWLTSPKALWDSQEIILCICNAYIEFQAEATFLWFCLTSYSVGDTTGKLLWNWTLSNCRRFLLYIQARLLKTVSYTTQF